MSVYILYSGPFTRGLLVEMVMAEGNIAYELRRVDIVKHEHHSPEFLAINPTGGVPALITPEGATLHETPAINLYLAERHGLAHLAPRIDEPERAQFLSGLFYLTGELEPVMKRYFYSHRYVLRNEDSPAMKVRSLGEALERLAVIEQRLRDGGPYQLGERFSLVDLTMTYWADCIDSKDVFDPYPAIRKCMRLVKDRPELRANFDELSASRDEYAQMQRHGKGVM